MTSLVMRLDKYSDTSLQKISGDDGHDTLL